MTTLSLSNLLREDVASSFSDLWYRVGPSRPRLGSHARIIRQSFGNAAAYVAEDPARGEFYRMSESAYVFLSMLDGTRTVDQAWEACNAQLGDEAPTQRECVDLLSKLQLYGLLTGDEPLAPEMVAQRRQEARTTRWKRRTGYGFSLVVPLLNPERPLERASGIIRLIFGPLGLVLWCLSAGAGLIAVLANAGAVGSSLNGILDPSNLIYLGLAFIVLRAWHELGHACAVKAYGGRCTEVGLMLVALVFPFPYCDASSAWKFPAVRSRVIVGAAGMLFETFLAGLAALVWAFSEPGLVRSIAFNAMLISGVTTLVFNLNPLMRYDGYYMLQDLTGTANLWQRSRELWRFLFERVAFGVERSRPPATRGTDEFWLMFGFALLSWPYRTFVVLSIAWILFTSEHYAGLGVVLGAIALVMWVVWPMLKTIGYLATSPRILGRRVRAIGVTAAAVAVLVIGLGVIPVSAHAYGWGTIEPANTWPGRAGESGFIEDVAVRSGERVEAGQVLMRLRNAELTATLEAAQAGLERAQAERDAMSNRPALDQAMAQRRVELAQAEVDRFQVRVDALVMRAAIAGTITTPKGVSLGDLPGTFVERGTLVVNVEQVERPVVRALVADSEFAYAFGRGTAPSEIRAELRLRGRAGEQIEARVVRAAPAGTRDAAGGDRSALTTMAGGSVAVDPRDPRGQRTLVPQFLVELEPKDPGVALYPGQRARVRFEAPPEPLLSQWWRRLMQQFTDRVRA